SGVCFAQDPATQPAIGYKDSYQGNFINNIQQAPPQTPLVNLINMGLYAQLPNQFQPNQANGDICVNVYAFSQAGTLQTCCSCRVPPNGAVGLTPASLGTTVVQNNYSVLKVMSTLPLTNTSTCDATVQPSSPGAAGGLASGMVAW